MPLTRSAAVLYRGFLAWFIKLLKATTNKSIRAWYFFLDQLQRVWRLRRRTILNRRKGSVSNADSDLNIHRASYQQLTILPSYDPSMRSISLHTLHPNPDTGSAAGAPDQNGSAIHSTLAGSTRPLLPANNAVSFLNSRAPASRSTSDLAGHRSQAPYTFSVRSFLRSSPRSSVSSPSPPHSLYTGGNPSAPSAPRSPRSPLPLHVAFDASPRPPPRVPRNLVPIPATAVQRYHRKVRIRNTRSKYTIEVGTKDFGSQKIVPGWIACTHPEGALYFFNPEKKIYTDANLYKHKNFEVITTCANRIFDEAKQQNIDLNDKSELVLELMDVKRSKQWKCGYYFVEHTSRSIFWAHPYEAEPIFGGVKGVKSQSHIKYAIEAQYWMHCELFPYDRRIPPDLFDELKEIIMHATAESITSDTSLAPFDREELGRMLDLTDYLQGNVHSSFSAIAEILSASGEKRFPHSMCVMARFLRMFARTKFFNFCGQIGARLDADQTVYYKDKRRKSVLLRILSPLLFGAPDIHTKGLKTIWVDQLVNHIPWKKFIDSLNSEWQEFTLYATVVLNANVAFLAVPGVDLGTGGTQSPAQVASYISIVASVGAVILGLLLVRQNRTKGRESAEEAALFMTKMTHSMFGTETLAILYSLPYALLMWGMVFFVLAFAFLVFDQTTLSTRGTVGSAGATVGLFVFCTIWAAWDNHLPRYWRSFMHGMLRRWKERVHREKNKGRSSGDEPRTPSPDHDSDTTGQSDTDGEP
ncbi:hypothetical protein BJ138DRAFT_1079243 [Hygrophoropsis aurantiaca]|uniref:Uncharacterized protein n=1 Tax=Hygrophoropsis aurantiaca TaxID=72124 RepID=A0ACB8ALV3_9AGAM|nr:hypothetical protein BJ138DRAFT_1079243 [Hygrophoropsis aurantiaca]